MHSVVLGKKVSPEEERSTLTDCFIMLKQTLFSCLNKLNIKLTFRRRTQDRTIKD